MEPNKPVETPEEAGETYTPRQRVILKVVQWGAWTAAIVAILDVIHS